MNKTWLCLVVLILVSSSFQIAASTSDSPSYDVMADINRDRTVDVNDLHRLGKAYGSTQTIPTQPGKTTVYVYQLEADPAEVETARVAIIDPNFGGPGYQARLTGYTDSTGISTFTLSPNSNYTAIAWGETTYNYANFTTNSFGEASVAIQLGYPQLPPNWVTITMLNKSSGEFWFEAGALVEVGELVWIYPPGLYRGVYDWVSIEGGQFLAEPFKGVLVIFGQQVNESGELRCAKVVEETGSSLGDYGYTPDENGNANVITYV